jgi:hypothetical protein
LGRVDQSSAWLEITQGWFASMMKIT